MSVAYKFQPEFNTWLGNVKCDWQFCEEYEASVLNFISNAIYKEQTSTPVSYFCPRLDGGNPQLPIAGIALNDFQVQGEINLVKSKSFR